jgi:hypothetical protein
VLADGAVEHRQTFQMDNGDVVEAVYRLFAADPTVDLGIALHSAGDHRPYSLVFPFTLPGSGETSWHFDTAGALVKFDEEQLPNACRHYITARRFVRMATNAAALTIATPDLPLWKFGGMFFEPSDKLDPSLRRPVSFAWLANNYWETNFLANQFGLTSYRFRLIPTPPQPVEFSYRAALPYAVAPRLHAYRGAGPVRRTEESLFHVDGDGVLLDAISTRGPDLFLTVSNLRSELNVIQLIARSLTWDNASVASLDGTPVRRLEPAANRATRVTLDPRQTIGLLLHEIQVVRT